MLLKWNAHGLDEIIALADRFVKTFVDFLASHAIEVRDHTPLEEVEM